MRFPEFKGEWEDKKLGDVATISSGGTPNRSKLEYWEGSIPWVSTSLINFNTIYNTEEKITEKGLQYSSAKIYPKDTILMAMYGQGKTRGKVAILGIDASINQACASIQTNQSILNSLFLFQNLSKRYSEIRGLSNQGGQENLSGAIIKEIKVSYPSLLEQEKIALFFSFIDQRIKTQIKIIEKYESLIKGIRYYILEESTHYDYLGNLCDIIKGQQVNLDNLLKHGKYYVMNGGTQPSGYYNSYNTDAGTISISEGGNSCGYVQYNKENFWSGGHCYTLQNIENELTEKYLYHYLKSNEKKIMALRVGSGLPNIQKKDLMSLRIPIPTKENQKKISCLLDSIEDKISVETNVLKHEIRQKRYLLRQMFI